MHQILLLFTFLTVLFAQGPNSCNLLQCSNSNPCTTNDESCCSGVCIAAPNLTQLATGAACNQSDPCSGVCGFGQDCVNGFCANFRQGHEFQMNDQGCSCTNSSQCIISGMNVQNNLNCTNSICSTVNGSLGTNCDYNFPCDSTGYCKAPGICAPRITVGGLCDFGSTGCYANCDQSSICQTGYFCNQNGSFSNCTALLSNGDTCFSSTDCASGFCESTACAPLPALYSLLGGAFTPGSQYCASGISTFQNNGNGKVGNKKRTHRKVQSNHKTFISTIQQRHCCDGHQTISLTDKWKKWEQGMSVEQ